MPNITKHFHIDITPEQFLTACSKEELMELDLLLDNYLKIYRILDKEKSLEENPNKCRECGLSYDTMVSKDLCVNCWEGNPTPNGRCYKTKGICDHNCPGQCRESC